MFKALVAEQAAQQTKGNKVVVSPDELVAVVGGRMMSDSRTLKEVGLSDSAFVMLFRKV